MLYEDIELLPGLLEFSKYTGYRKKNNLVDKASFKINVNQNQFPNFENQAEPHKDCSYISQILIRRE